MKKTLVLLLALIGIGAVVRLYNDFMARSERSIRDKHRRPGDTNYMDLSYRG